MLDGHHERWDHLLVLLGEMQVGFQNFLSLLGEEQRFLGAMDQQGVATITEKKEQALDIMCGYDQQVRVVVHQLAGPENLEQLGAWLKQLRHPRAFKANTIFHELFGLTREIQAQSKKNDMLIRRTQHIVREAINLIYTGLGTGPVYQGSGALQFSSVPSSVSLRG